MLGNGRPFIIELGEPKKAVSSTQVFKIKELENNINNNSEHVKVKNIEVVGKEKFEEIRQGEENKLKVYACIVWTEKFLENSDIEKINSLAHLNLKQKTPIRVMHRRTLKTRDKTVLRMKATMVNHHFFLLRLVTSGGTYVKEFVHSDFGRTVPSISSLLQSKTDILQLDVLGLGWSLSEIEHLLDSEIE